MNQTPNQIGQPTPFSTFIDSITNKLTVYGIFNALLIFSLTLKDGTGQKLLAVSCLMLNFFMLILIINDTYIKCREFNYNTIPNSKVSEAMYYGFFIALLITAFLGLLVYSVVELPFFIQLLVPSLFVYATGTVVYQIFRLIEKYTTIKISVYLFYLVTLLAFLIISYTFLFKSITIVESWIRVK